jgi:outer membrane protein assembly factor BamD
MKKIIFNIVIFTSIAVLFFANAAQAYWIWTPETKKFINPKYAVKDSPKEQLDWAMSFYNAKDYQRAATEFDKLVKQYEFSEYASQAQYYVGLCYENMQKYYTAYENYQKAIDNFPHISNTDEILAREYNIGNIYLNKPSPKILKTDIMAPLDRAIEIFKKVVSNAPYGKYAQDAQFKLGQALKKSEQYEEAVGAFHKIAEDYPNSKLVQQAMFEEADCAYKASLRPAYDATSTDSAIKTFEKFVNKNKDADLSEKADKTMKRLKDNVAEKSFRAAEFYEFQGKKEAAIIYYQDVVDTYPDSNFAIKAKAKIGELKNRDQKKAVESEETAKKKLQAIADREAKKQKAIADSQAQKQKLISDREARKQKALEHREAKKQKAIADREARKQKIIADRETRKQKALEQREAREKEAITNKESSKKQSWNPLEFMNKKAAPKNEPAAQAVKVQEKKAWKPLSFDSKKEKPAPEAQAAPKKKEWKLWPFGNNNKEEWKPLNQGVKKEEGA